ncbi:MAG: hypothetical protein ACOC04_01645 [Halothece sp.]
MNSPNQSETNEEAKKSTPTASGGKQTPIDPAIRKTSSGTQSPTKNASPTEPGEGSAKAEGDPNQGTEAR